MKQEQQTKTESRRTLFEVEREKRWRIWLLFGLLVALAFVTAWVGCLVVTVIVYFAYPEPSIVTWLFTPAGIAIVLGASLAVALVYWGLAQIGALGRLMTAMHCRPLDPGDRYHARLANIVEEMRLASGAPRVDCVTVRTVGLNAFAFSDLRGGGVIGVTEGALARLSRQQLEAVVAHEFAHVLSGSYVTVTVSCLLFGIYSSLAEGMDSAADASSDRDTASAVVLVLPLRGWLWVMQLASSVVNAAISRQREWQADLAAVRYTRDPLALAEALRVIGRHPGGAGYIPEGLAPLCIRATGSLGWPAVAWRDSHPPLEARIRALLGVAHVSPAEFERQAAEAAEDFDHREHWSPAPGAAEAPALDAAPAFASARPASPFAAAPPAASTGPLPGAVAPLEMSPGAATVLGAGMTCPGCGAGLVRTPYEGIDIVACRRCGGRLVTTAQIGKLLARREAGFTEAQHRLADLVTASGDTLRRAAVLARGRPGVGLVACPKCAAPMMRRHYSYEYAVEVDLCARCDLTWFEKDELEALQILVERQAG
jgi:Zn-dependent protease with chaperone function/Zn-finger nucleic acid-binding protein